MCYRKFCSPLPTHLKQCFLKRKTNQNYVLKLIYHSRLIQMTGRWKVPLLEKSGSYPTNNCLQFWKAPLPFLFFLYFFPQPSIICILLSRKKNCCLVLNIWLIFKCFLNLIKNLGLQCWFLFIIYRLCTESFVTFISALYSVSEPIELSAVGEAVEQGVPEKEESPPPVDPGQ